MTDRRKVSVLQAIRRRLAPGRAADYIRPFEINPGDRVVICCRVSRRTQNHRGNLDDQESRLRQIVEASGGIVVGVVREVGPGWHPYWLRKAVRLAVQHEAVCLLAETPDRFIRSPYYHSSWFPKAQAREEDLQELALFTEPMPLMTVVPPDATPGEQRSHQIRRGQTAKGRKGGRPKKSESPKETRLRLLEPALKLRNEGWSYREIGRQLNVPHSTIQDWERKYG